MRTLRMSPSTEGAYVHWTVQYILHFGGTRNPADMGGKEVTEFLSWLATEKKCAAGTVNQAQSALRFVYKHCMNRPNSKDRLVTASEASKILAALPAIYRPIIISSGGLKSIRESAKKIKRHHNAPLYMLASVSQKTIGRRVNIHGFRNSVILHSLGSGLPWKDAQKKYGAQSVKWACADFVRQFGPKVILDNLAS